MSARQLLVAFLGLVGLLVVACLIFQSPPDVPANAAVNEHSFVTLRTGMQEMEVISVLGTPHVKAFGQRVMIKRPSSPEPDFGIDEKRDGGYCDSLHVYRGSNEEEIRVLFARDGQGLVAAEYYLGGLAVYYCGSKRPDCPSRDSIAAAGSKDWKQITDPIKLARKNTLIGFFNVSFGSIQPGSGPNQEQSGSPLAPTVLPWQPSPPAPSLGRQPSPPAPSLGGQPSPPAPSLGGQPSPPAPSLGGQPAGAAQPGPPATQPSPFFSLGGGMTGAGLGGGWNPAGYFPAWNARRWDEIQLPSGGRISRAATEPAKTWAATCFPKGGRFAAWTYPNGSLWAVAAHERGKLDGFAAGLHPLGSLAVLAEYKHGDLDGPLRLWNQQKQVLLFANYSGGKKSGLLVFFDAATPWLVQEYDDDVVRDQYLIRFEGDKPAALAENSLTRDDRQALDLAQQRLKNLEAEMRESEQKLKDLVRTEARRPRPRVGSAAGGQGTSPAVPIDAVREEARWRATLDRAGF